MNWRGVALLTILCEITFVESKEKLLCAGESVMIKSLFEENENQPEEIKPETETATVETSKSSAEPRYVEVNEAENLLDIPEVEFDRLDDLEASLSDTEIESINSFVETKGESANLPDAPFQLSENLFAETTSEAETNVTPVEILDETETIAPVIETADTTSSVNFILSAEKNAPEEKNAYDNETLFQTSAPPRRESLAETARNSGLAYAAAITLFGAVIFMMIIGWFADLLLGSSPWGIVGGIVLGSIIGFIQFFRVTSQIFKDRK